MPEEVKIYKLILKSSRHEYGDVWTFVFKSEEPVPFKAGQYTHLRLSSLETKRVHEFSFASAPDDNEIWFSVHVRGKGSYKQSLYKENLLSLKPGDSVELFKIKGNFLLPEEPNQHLVFIAGGLGVTPFRSMLRDIELKHLSFTVTLVHVDRGPYLYESELSQMPIEQYRVTRTEVGSTLENITKKFPKAVYYVVGSPNFAQDINDKLRPLGISSTQIKNDDWGYW